MKARDKRKRRKARLARKAVGRAREVSRMNRFMAEYFPTCFEHIGDGLYRVTL